MVNRFYSSSSSADKGTVFQLKQLVHRTSFVSDPKKNMKAVEDFLELVVVAHVITASKMLQEELTTATTVQGCTDLSKSLVQRFIRISVPNVEQILADLNSEDATDDLNSEDTTDDSPQEVEDGINDSVHSYAVDILTLGLLWFGFRDAVREGDANRIVLYWKFLVPLFRQEKHYNYSNEGWLFIAQTLLLSPREVCDLKWNRTVNTTGRIGKNIPVDLHMEHLNRRLKIMIRKLGSNVSPPTVLRASKALAVVDTVRLQFLKDDLDNSAQNTENKDFHTTPSFKKDLDMILQQLSEQKVFEVHAGRQHKAYQDHKPLLQSIIWNYICKWCRDKILNHISIE